MDGSDETREIVTDPPTVRVPATHAPPRPAYLALVFCSVAAAGFLVGIAVAAGSRPAPKTMGDIAAQLVVGPSGATIRFDNGQIEIPADALSQPAHIIVRRSSFNDRVRVIPGSGTPQVYDPGGLDAYTFEPKNIVFRRPVRIVFRLPAGAHNGTTFARIGNDIVILGGSTDSDRQTVTIVVRDFRFGHKS